MGDEKLQSPQNLLSAGLANWLKEAQPQEPTEEDQQPPVSPHPAPIDSLADETASIIASDDVSALEETPPSQPSVSALPPVAADLVEEQFSAAAASASEPPPSEPPGEPPEDEKLAKLAKLKELLVDGKEHSFILHRDTELQTYVATVMDDIVLPENEFRIEVPFDIALRNPVQLRFSVADIQLVEDARQIPYKIEAFFEGIVSPDYQMEDWINLETRSELLHDLSVNYPGGGNNIEALFESGLDRAGIDAQLAQWHAGQAPIALLIPDFGVVKVQGIIGNMTDGQICVTYDAPSASGGTGYGFFSISELSDHFMAWGKTKNPEPILGGQLKDLEKQYDRKEFPTDEAGYLEFINAVLRCKDKKPVIVRTKEGLYYELLDKPKNSAYRARQISSDSILNIPRADLEPEIAEWYLPKEGGEAGEPPAEPETDEQLTKLKELLVDGKEHQIRISRDEKTQSYRVISYGSSQGDMPSARIDVPFDVARRHDATIPMKVADVIPEKGGVGQESEVTYRIIPELEKQNLPGYEAQDWISYENVEQTFNRIKELYSSTDSSGLPDPKTTPDFQKRIEELHNQQTPAALQGMDFGQDSSSYKLIKIHGFADKPERLVATTEINGKISLIYPDIQFLYNSCLYWYKSTGEVVNQDKRGIEAAKADLAQMEQPIRFSSESDLRDWQDIVIPSAGKKLWDIVIEAKSRSHCDVQSPVPRAFADGINYSAKIDISWSEGEPDLIVINREVTSISPSQRLDGYEQGGILVPNQINSLSAAKEAAKSGQVIVRTAEDDYFELDAEQKGTWLVGRAFNPEQKISTGEPVEIKGEIDWYKPLELGQTKVIAEPESDAEPKVESGTEPEAVVETPREMTPEEISASKYEHIGDGTIRFKFGENGYFDLKSNYPETERPEIKFNIGNRIIPVSVVRGIMWHPNERLTGGSEVDIIFRDARGESTTERIGLDNFRALLTESQNAGLFPGGEKIDQEESKGTRLLFTPSGELRSWLLRNAEVAEKTARPEFSPIADGVLLDLGEEGAIPLIPGVSFTAKIGENTKVLVVESIEKPDAYTPESSIKMKFRGIDGIATLSLRKIKTILSSPENKKNLLMKEGITHE